MFPIQRAPKDVSLRLEAERAVQLILLEARRQKRALSLVDITKCLESLAKLREVIVVGWRDLPLAPTLGGLYYTFLSTQLGAYAEFELSFSFGTHTILTPFGRHKLEEETKDLLVHLSPRAQRLIKKVLEQTVRQYSAGLNLHQRQELDERDAEFAILQGFVNP